MKVYYNNTFDGHYPVGTSAIVIAKDQVEAAEKLAARLRERGLKQSITWSRMIEVDTTGRQVIILQDGDY